MTQNITLRGILANAMNLAVFFIFSLIVVFSGCTTENFDEATKTVTPPPVVISGDTIAIFNSDNKFTHGQWDIANGLIQRENVNYGYINRCVKKDGKVIVIENINLNEKSSMSFKWTPMSEVQGKVKMDFLGVSRDASPKTTKRPNGYSYKNIHTGADTLKFDGQNVALKYSYEILHTANAVAEHDSLISINYEYLKTDTLDGTINEVSGDYKRATVQGNLVVTLKHIPADTLHTEKFPFNYTGKFRVNVKPGEKIYQGKKVVEGSDKYYPLENGNFWAERTYVKTFIQDGKTITEEVKFGGEARIIWGVPAGNTFTVKDIEIGDPQMIPSYEDAKDFVDRGKGLKALVRTYSFPFVWANEYRKTNTCAVDMLSAYDEDDTYALPTGESAMSFSKYDKGNPTTETDFTVYYDGVLYFKGVHSSTNLKSSKEYSLEKAQVFQVKINKVFIGYRFVTTFDKTTGASQIDAYEIWKGEPEKLVATYKTTMTQKAYGQDVVRFFGSSLSFISGLSKSVESPKDADFKAEGNGVYAASIKTTFSARLNLGMTSFYHERSKKYVMHGEKQVFFEGYDEPSVGNFGDGNITLTNTNDNYVESGEKYTRRAYNATLAINGKDVVNSINVDELAPKEPTTDPEFGYLDWEKTKQIGGLSIAWDVEIVNGQPTLKPVINVTVATSAGILNNVEKANYFYKTNTSLLTSRFGGTLNVGTGNKWIPSTIEVKSGSTGNPFWYYLGIDGTSPTSVNGVDILKIDGVSLNKPFLSTPDDGTATFTNKNGHVVVTYKGEVVFDEIFPVK